MTDKLSVWDLITQGDYVGACQLADEEYKDSGSLLPLRNKTLALLQLRRYDEAISLLENIIDRDDAESDYDFQFLGTAKWLSLQRESCVAIWKEALDAKYTDAAGGVEIPLLLFFASVLLNDSSLKKESLSLIRKRTKSKQSTNWPGPVGRYVLGRISESELDDAVTITPFLKDKQVCQAQFYKSIASLNNGSKDYLKYLEAVPQLEPSCHLKPEYYLAISMLSKPELQ